MPLKTVLFIDSTSFQWQLCLYAKAVLVREGCACLRRLCSTAQAVQHGPGSTEPPRLHCTAMPAWRATAAPKLTAMPKLTAARNAQAVLCAPGAHAKSAGRSAEPVAGGNPSRQRVPRIRSHGHAPDATRLCSRAAASHARAIADQVTIATVAWRDNFLVLPSCSGTVL
jgi:hypothetical protein